MKKEYGKFIFTWAILLGLAATPALAAQNKNAGAKKPAAKAAAAASGNAGATKSGGSKKGYRSHRGHRRVPEPVLPQHRRVRESEPHHPKGA
jgi:hypothetical protein